jgi:hypothetical protein
VTNRHVIAGGERAAIKFASGLVVPQNRHGLERILLDEDHARVGADPNGGKNEQLRLRSQ